MSTLRHIIFDVGKVLFDYDPEKIVSTLVPDTTFHSDYLSHLFLAPLWDEMDRGDILPETAKSNLKNQFKNHAQMSEELDTLFDQWMFHLDPMTDSIALFNQFLVSHSVYILSNFQSRPFDHLPMRCF